MIKIGDKIPRASVQTMSENGPVVHNTDELFGQGKTVLFAVPGAYTPTCSKAHLPGFVVKTDEIKAKGVDRIVCMAVNDAFVMSAWGKANNAEHLIMLADGNAEFTKALGLDSDAAAYGMGTRSRRFAMIIEDGVVKHLAVEQPREFQVSSAEAILAKL